MPTIPSAPLLPLKDPVGTVVDEVEEDVPVNGVDFGVRLERPELRANVGKVRVVNRQTQHLHSSGSRGGRARGRRKSGRGGCANVEGGSLAKHGVDVSYRGGLEGISWTASGMNTMFRWTGNNSVGTRTYPGSTTGIVTVMVRSEVWTVFFNANVLRKLLLVRSAREVSG